MSLLSATTLLYPVRPIVVAQRTGQIALLLSGMTTLPLAVALLTGDSHGAWRYGLVIVALAAGGFWLARRDAPRTVQLNEAMVVSLLAFTLTPLAMTYPLMAAGIGFGDALFECISGITTTGLSTLVHVSGRPPSFLFERAWMQWLGGLGIVVLSVALLAGDDVAARRLVESPVSPDTLDTSSRLHARRSFVTYALLTALAITLLWLAGWSGFDALVLSMAAISTGGFAPHDASLAAAPNGAARLAVMAVACLGAVSLPLYHLVWRRRWLGVAQDPELRLLLAACAFGGLLLLLTMSAHQGGMTPQRAADALIMAVSAQTTSGFSSLPPAALDDASLWVLIVAMAVGGSVGSTAGGIKLLRLLLLLRVAQLIMWRTAMPRHAVATIHLRQRVVSEQDMAGTLFMVLLFTATVMLSWLVFLVFGHPPMKALFEVVSAVGTVGLSTGITGPDLHPLLKGVLCVDMLMGRVEFIAALVVVFPHTWFARRRSE
jgi:trk system potassium uptake protein